jgi:hypothetical protein
MRKLDDVRNALAANELLSIMATSHIKGGDGGTATDDEKRRQRPGGGISTNRPCPGAGSNDKG